MSAVLNDNRTWDMASERSRHRIMIILETVIKLRRGLLGFRETRSQGGYCSTGTLSVPTESYATERPAVAIDGRLHPGLSGFLPLWLPIAPGRSGSVE
jgi:hypothetical protein